jgi:hypothetical protein
MSLQERSLWPGRDVEAGENESGTVRRSELGMETIPRPASVTESRNEGKDSS